MNKKNTRKGFTIVELVIVIAVIAILATVLIPTFGNIIEKANKSSALQDARNQLTNYMIDTNAQGADDLIIQSGKYFFAVVDGNLQDTAYESMTADADEPDALEEFDNGWVATAVEVGEGETATIWTVAAPTNP